MLQKKQNKPIGFTDGVCEICTIEKRTVKEKLGTFDFKEETVGIKAFTEFQVLGIQVDKAISIPYNTIAEIGRICKLNQDSNYYEIQAIQKKDTFPITLKLTLSKTNIKWNEDNA